MYDINKLTWRQGKALIDLICAGRSCDSCPFKHKLDLPDKPRLQNGCARLFNVKRQRKARIENMESVLDWINLHINEIRILTPRYEEYLDHFPRSNEELEEFIERNERENLGLIEIIRSNELFIEK